MNATQAIAKISKPVLAGTWFIVLATVAAYWPVFSAGFIWDDDAYVTNNPLLTAPDGWGRIWFSAHTQSQYFPLVFSTLRLENSIWGLNPLGYHLVNVALHIANALLIWALLRRLALPGAWLAAAMFALHPVQVETVAWVTELKNTESTLFYLLALFAWLNFFAGKGFKFYALALFTLALALFAKTTACTFPAVALLLAWLGGEPLPRCRIFQVLPFLAMGLGMGLVSVWWEGHLGNYDSQLHLLGGPLDRILIASRALWFYAGKIFWPAEFIFTYPHWEIDASDWRQYVWPFLCLGLVALLWLARKKLDRRVPLALLFFAIVLSPMLGFVPLFTFYLSYVADHYQYFACLGLLALFAGAAEKLAARLACPFTVQIVFALGLLFGLGQATWNQCHAYASLEALWLDTLKKNPRAWMADTNLGWLRVEQGDLAAGEQCYLAALAIHPDDAILRYNYANLLARTGRLPEAVENYQAGIKLSPGKAEIHSNLGAVYFRLKAYAAAADEFRAALKIKPLETSYHFNLGSVLAAQTQTNAAAEEYRRTLEIDPQFEPAKKRLQALGGSAN